MKTLSEQVDDQYKNILRCDLYNEMMRRCITVDLDKLDSYSINELENKLSKLIEW